MMAIKRLTADVTQQVGWAIAVMDSAEVFRMWI